VENILSQKTAGIPVVS